MDPQLELLLARSEEQRRRVTKIVSILGGIAASGRVYPSAGLELSAIVPEARRYADRASSDMASAWLSALDARLDLFSEVSSASENKQLAAATHMRGVAQGLLDAKRIGDTWDDLTCAAGAALDEG